MQTHFLIATGAIVRHVTESSLDQGILYTLNLELQNLQGKLKRARNPMRKLELRNKIETVNYKLLLWEK